MLGRVSILTKIQQCLLPALLSDFGCSEMPGKSFFGPDKVGTTSLRVFRILFTRNY